MVKVYFNMQELEILLQFAPKIRSSSKLNFVHISIHASWYILSFTFLFFYSPTKYTITHKLQLTLYTIRG